MILRDLILEKALVIARPGEKFRLASGEKSSYYFDVKKVTLFSGGTRAIAEALGPLIPPEIRFVGGLEAGSLPIITTLLEWYTKRGQVAYGFFVRKQPKSHGLQGDIEGNFDPAHDVVVVDDVTTSGSSLLDAVGKIEKAGGSVRKVLTLIDRERGGA